MICRYNCIVPKTSQISNSRLEIHSGIGFAGCCVKLLAEDAFANDTLYLLQVLLKYEEQTGSVQFRDSLVALNAVQRLSHIVERYYNEWHNGVGSAF